MRVARRVAKSIVDRQIQSHAMGKEGGKDVMSILGEYFYLDRNILRSFRLKHRRRISESQSV
jgi:hypothetical protein